MRSRRIYRFCAQQMSVQLTFIMEYRTGEDVSIQFRGLAAQERLFATFFATHISSVQMRRLA